MALGDTHLRTRVTRRPPSSQRAACWLSPRPAAFTAQLMARRRAVRLTSTTFDQLKPTWMAGPSMSRRAASKPSRATHKSERASAQAVWLRRRRSSINEPIANPPSATTGMTKRALRIVPPHCRSDGKSTAAGNLNHLSRPDGSCLAGWRAARNSRWGEFIMTATPDDRVRAR